MTFNITHKPTMVGLYVSCVIATYGTFHTPFISISICSMYEAHFSTKSTPNFYIRAEQRSAFLIFVREITSMQIENCNCRFLLSSL